MEAVCFGSLAALIGGVGRIGAVWLLIGEIGLDFIFPAFLGLPVFGVAGLAVVLFVERGGRVGRFLGRTGLGFW